MNPRDHLIRLAFLLSMALATAAHGAPPAKFAWLPVGQVQPRGWLLDQITTDATTGYGPLLDKLTDRCDLSTFDCRGKSALAKPKIGAVWWNGETTGNWLDALIRTAYLSNNDVAKRQVDEMVKRILAMQEPDGYLGTYPKAIRYEHPVKTNNGELWSQTCLFRGLLAYYEFTGRADVLEAVRRASSLMISSYGKDKPYWPQRVAGGGGPGHNLMFVDACEWLHRITADQQFVEFARFLYDGFNQAPAGEADIQCRHLAKMDELFGGHGAHVMEHLRVPLFVYYATADAKYRDAVENIFPKTARHLSAGGACISDESIGQRLGSPSIGCEYCTMLEMLNSLQSGVQKTGRAALADSIELLAYNSAQGARQRDGKAIQYCTRDNQLQITQMDIHRRAKMSPTHDDVAVCCPVTALKFFPYFTSGLWMKTAAGDGIVAVNYAPNELTTTLNGVKIRIQTDTAYPFEDQVRMTITPEKPINFSLWLRVPAWAGKMTIESAGATATESDGWRVLSKEWQAGDHVTIAFDAPIERKTMPNREVYWQRGPLVFALPITAERHAVRKYAVEGFADYEYSPVVGAFHDYGIDEGSGGFHLEKSAPATRPWSEPPLRLAGNLLNRNTKTNQAVALVPMGTSILRRTTFANAAGNQAVTSANNLARGAKIEAGNSAAGYRPEAMIDGVIDGFPENIAAEWASRHGGVGTKVKLTWAQPIHACCIWLYDRPNPADQVKAAKITFSDGSTETAGELPNDAATPFKLKFARKTISWMELVVTQVSPSTKNVGFAEIAVFGDDPDEKSKPAEH